jgi:regulator of protease activity HflC (stomatin/prohibitin superfamily)
VAEIRRFPFVRHLRSDPTAYVLRYRGGRLVQSGPGLAFWFRPLHTSLVEVPVDDRELQLHVHGRSADFQDIAVQAALTFRVDEPRTISGRIDFTIDPEQGSHVRTPLEQLAGLLTQLAQGFVWGHLVATPLATLLTSGVQELERRLREGFAADERAAGLGISVSAVSVLAVRPTPEVERALQTPELERVQAAADKATFERRAAAVEQERAISENELQNRIELARREEALVDQERLNGRKRAEADAEAQSVAARGEAARIAELSGARVGAERARIAVYRDTPVPLLHALALRDLARNLPAIEHLTVASDLLTPLLARLADGAGK